MAWTYSGTSTDYLDLLDDLRAALVAAGWTAERWTGGNELIVKGPGSGSRSDFYLGIKEESGTGYYNLRMAGLTGYLAGQTFTNQPGYSANYCAILNAWNSSIPYWISINDDRFILIAKVSTKYHWLGGGLLKVYGTDTQYGYPLFAFGGAYTLASTAYSSVTSAWSCYLLQPGGTWGTMTLRHSPTTDLTIDSKYPLWPCYIRDTATNIFGEIESLHGFPSISGTNAEDTITVGSDVYLVAPNSSTITQGSFLALLES